MDNKRISKEPHEIDYIRKIARNVLKGRYSPSIKRLAKAVIKFIRR
jgi:hypothetical protein